MTDDVQLIEQLLSRMESDDLDFKRDQYKLESDREKSGFIKDIICMANTPREGSAYILVGVESHDGRLTNVVGTDIHPDPAEFGRLLSGKVNTSPKFEYRVIDYSGKEIGLFEIHPTNNIPIMLRSRFERLNPGTIYIRRSTENVEANSDEISRIVNWSKDQPDVDEPDGIAGSWEQLYRACDGFAQERVYIAVLDQSTELTPEDWRALAYVGWQVVIDFDQLTDERGGYFNASQELATRKSLRLTALDDQVNTSPVASVWVAVKGLQSRPSTVKEKTWREWNQTKARSLQSLLREVSRVTETQPVTTVVFSGEHEYVESVCTLVDQEFGDRGEFVFATHQASMYSPIVKKYDASEVLISAPEICRGLRDTQRAMSTTENLELPRLDRGTVPVPPDRARWVEEELEILHIGSGLLSPNPETELRDFLRGFPISWYGLSARVDVDRGVTSDLERRLRDALSSRATRRVNLWHWPGAGGSTVARRAGWDIHTEYPVLLARQVEPSALVERIRYLFSLTGLPLLVLVEASSTSRENLDRAYDSARSANLPAVFLYIERRQKATSQNAGGVYLDAMLTTPEAVLLRDRLAREVPERRGALDNLVNERDRRRRTPFLFGLVAFEKDFAGLEQYVKNRIVGKSEAVLKVCRISALAYHFGQQAMPIQFFSAFLGLPQSKLASLSDVLPDDLQELFVPVAGKSIRPSHELVAFELLEQLLSLGQADKRNWRLELADNAIEFIELAARHQNQPGGVISELVRAVVIERDTEDAAVGFTESQFSSLINAIPSTEGKQRVLENLVDCFPDEPHFLSHLGRFYSRVTHDHPKAQATHQRATGLSPADPLLHHMYGMAWREEIYDLLDSIADRGMSRESEETLHNLVEQASREFSESLKFDSRSEYSYISPVQMVVRIVGQVARLKGFGQETDQFLSNPGQTWYQELVDAAENLLSDLSLARTGEDPSRLQQAARTRLDSLYGDYSKVIQGWTNILDRRDVYRPPVRRSLIRAYLSRRNHDWSRLNPRDLKRVSELANENLVEEPDSDQNLRLWFRVVRITGELPLEQVAERLAYRRLRRPSVDTLYYLYVLKFLQADAGMREMVNEAQEIIKECSRLAESLPQRTKSFEWFGPGNKLDALVHESALGEWDPSAQFWSKAASLKRVRGRISRIQSPASGEIELPTGLSAFFVPSRGMVEGGYLSGRDINREVEFYLGFSYDGLRAWSVGDPEGSTHQH